MPKSHVNASCDSVHLTFLCTCGDMGSGKDKPTHDMCGDEQDTLAQKNKIERKITALVNVLLL